MQHTFLPTPDLGRAFMFGLLMMGFTLAPTSLAIGEALGVGISTARVEERLALRLAEVGPEARVPVIVRLRREGLPARRAARGSWVRERQARAIARLPAGQFRVGRRFRMLNAFSMHASKSAIERLLEHPEVLSVEVDGTVRAHLAHGLSQIGATLAHEVGLTGSGINVAVLDTGIDRDHPALQDALVAEQCFCEDTPGSPSTGCCPNGMASQSGSGAAEDDDGHGSAVSGIITSNGAVGSVGVAPDAGIVAVKVLSLGGTGNFSDIAAGLDWVYENHASLGIRIVNLSLGDAGEYDDENAAPCTGSLTSDAIEDLADVGVVVIASSGNNAHLHGIALPACAPDAISVGAVYDRAKIGPLDWCTDASCDEITCSDDPVNVDVFSCIGNSGSLLDVVAPSWVTTTTDRSGGLMDFYGTSAAGAYVSGQAALLLQADPTLQPEEVRALLVASGPMVTNPESGRSFPRADVAEILSLPEPGADSALAAVISVIAFLRRRRND
jgi:subtilisin family serine protease